MNILFIIRNMLQSGVESVNNSPLRDFSALCLAEYLKWSIKQSSVEVL